MDGIGGCPNVGGICIGCTMPGFPDKFMPFMDEPPGSRLSTATSAVTGALMRRLREITLHTVDREPLWRHRGHQIDTGYDQHIWDGNGSAPHVTDESVTVRGKGHPEFSGKSVTTRGEDVRPRRKSPARNLPPVTPHQEDRTSRPR
jgi:hypothetical protein